MRQGLVCGCVPLPDTGLGEEPAPAEYVEAACTGGRASLWKMLESRGWPLGQRENLRGL